MASIPDFPVRDLKYEAITKCAHEDWNLAKLRNEKLQSVASSFRANIARVRFLMLLPTTIAGQMALTQRVHDIAEYELTGTLVRNEDSLPPDLKMRIDQRRLEMLQAHTEETLKKQGTTEWDDFVGKFHLDFAGALRGLMETPLGAYGFVDMLAAPITGTWTAIETMLGNLWEAAVNCHPETLASLKGKSTRIGKSESEMISDQRGGGPLDADPKSVPLNLIEMNKFDLRASMGTIFRRQRRFEFTRLSSIREAYSRAFSENTGKIDSALLESGRDAFLHQCAQMSDLGGARLLLHFPIRKRVHHDVAFHDVTRASNASRTALTMSAGSSSESFSKSVIVGLPIGQGYQGADRMSK